MFELLVDSVRDELLLGSNCGSRDIPLGTTFTAVRRSRLNPGGQSESVGGEKSVELTLTGVRWFNRDIDVIPGGHSAGLMVTGWGLVWLATALRVLPHGEYLSLVAGGSPEA